MSNPTIHEEADSGHFLGTFVERALEAGCDAW
jgi:hypothetical protein